MINIESAKKIDGWMTENELHWLAVQARLHSSILEIGSWHGRSTRALADNLLAYGTVYALDTFNGSKTEIEGHASAKLNGGDDAFINFLTNNYDHILEGKIVPLRGASENILPVLWSKRFSADMIFIDGGHTYEEVKANIHEALSVIQNNGLLCGHDYSDSWPGVKRAVDELLPGRKVIGGGSIWYVEIEKGDPELNESDDYDERTKHLV